MPHFDGRSVCSPPAPATCNSRAPLTTTRHPILRSIISIAALAAGIASGCSHRVVSVTVDASTTFQTIEGWGNGSGNLGRQLEETYRSLGSPTGDSVNFQAIDYLADDLGLTGTRIWELGARLDGAGNDSGDCDVIDWTRFQPGMLADVNGRYMMRFKERVIAGGSKPSFYSSTGYSAGAVESKPWMVNHPGERAQHVWSSALYWRDHYGIEMNYAVITNEPGSNGNSYTPGMLVDDIRALGPRLAAMGLATRIQFPEAINPRTSWHLVQATRNEPDIWPFIGRLSYHHYGAADPYRAELSAFGKSIGVRTAQTEMDPASVADLFDDLIAGGVSYWEVPFSSARTLVPNPGNTTFTPSAAYFPIRQVTHYVRPGAVRIGAASNDPSVRALAFTRDGRVTTILLNTGPARSVHLGGLAPGAYGLSRSGSGTSAFEELGVRTVGPSGTLTVGISPATTTTLYPYAGANHAPTIMTWKSNPGRVDVPATTTTLSVTATDPELDPLTFQWSVVRQPAGATAALSTPRASTTTVDGLTVNGTYVFKVDVRDGSNVSSKNVYVVRGENQPPLLGVTGFRMPAPYGYAMDYPEGTPVHANIALPTSLVTLSANVSDLEGDRLTGDWSVVRQPAGAAVTLGPTLFLYASFRSTVTGMTVPGDYVFQIAVRDRFHPAVIMQVICTVHPPNSAPVVISIAAANGQLTLPASATQLSAVTRDAEKDLLRHWWVVKSAPVGAKPVFSRQGWPVTKVTNLTAPGTYTFTVRAFDDIHMTTKDVTVTVAPARGGR